MLTSQQLERRKKSIGSSDMSAILGINRFKTAYDVWLEKTGKLMEVDTDAISDAADAGNRFEKSVLAWASQEMQMKLRRNVFMVAPLDLPIHAYIDAVVIANGEPVEAKTGGLFGPLWGEWGEPGSGDVPEPYIIQAHIEMLCAEREICHMPAFLGGRGFQLYHIPLNKDLMSVITERALNFWNEYVLKDTPPPEVAPSLHIMSRVKRTPGKRVRVSCESISNWQQADETAKEAAKRADEFKAIMLAELGDGDASEPVDIGDGLQELTFTEQERKSLDMEAIKTNYPEAVKTCMKVTKYRVARLKKTKITKGE